MNVNELSHASLDDIVFENRNKSYGAYLLRKLYDKNVIIATVISASVFSLLLATPVIIRLLTKDEVVVIAEVKKPEVKIIDVAIDPKEPKPLPLPKIEPPQIKTLKFVPPEPVETEEAETPPPPDETREEKNFADEEKEGDDGPITDLPDAPVGDPGGLGDDEGQEYFGSVDINPEPPGGKDGWAKYLQTNFSPHVKFFIQDRSIKGQVVVSFLISKDGSISDVRVIKGLANCPQCNEEAKRLIEKSPAWNPAKVNGNPVIYRTAQPIKMGN